MSKHQPWTDDEAKIAMNEAFLKEADEAARCCEDCRAKLVNADRYFDVGFFAGVTWAAAQIEKCSTIYAARSESRTWGMDQNPYDDTIKAKLVGVKEIEP